tara:strand:+ start:4087 stop:6447 length:2361 start_codon:yes stop_codon:yes gene_type:complete
VAKPSPYISFPTDFTSQEEKKQQKWCSEFAKAAHQRAISNFNGNIEENKKKFIDLRRQSEGYADVDKFKNVLSSSGNTAYLNLQWDTPTPLKAVVNNVVGQLTNQITSIRAKCISPFANTEYDKEFRRLQAQLFLAKNEQALAQSGVDVSSKINRSEVEKTQSDDEIELHLSLNFKDSYTSAINNSIQSTFAQNDFDYIEDKVTRDLVVCAKGCTKTFLDKYYNGNIRYVDVAQLIHSEVDKDNFKDAKYIGEYLFLTVDEVAEAAGSALSQEQLYNIAKSAKNMFGNPTWDGNAWGTKYYPNMEDGGMPWGRFKVKVLDIEYKSYDKIKYEVVPKRGGGDYFQKVNGKPKKKATKTVDLNLENIYKCSYVVGTEYTYNYGLKENMIRERINGKPSMSVDFGYTVYAPNIYDMKNKSLAEQCVGDSNMIAILKLKAQQLVAKMRPAGYAIDTARIAALSNGLGNKNFKPSDYIDVYEQTGVFPYAGTDEAGIQQGSPITLMPESMGSGLQMISLQIQEAYKSIEMVTGVPLSTIGSPSKDSLVGLEKIAAENRNNSLRYLIKGKNNIMTRTARQTYLMVQGSIKNGKVDDYVNSIGKRSADMLDFTKNLSAAEFDIFIEASPDIADQAEFNETLKIALANGHLKESDVMNLRDMAKTKMDEAKKYMQVWEDRYRRQEEEKAMKLSQNQAQAAAGAAQAAEKAKQQTLQFAHQLKLQELGTKAKLDSLQSGQDHDEKIKEILVEGDIKAEHIELATENDEKVNSGKDLRDKSLGTRQVQVEPRVFSS